jgi:hypothetical protein
VRWKYLNCGCKGKHEKKHKCGEFTGNESKEEKLKHLKECKEGLLKQIEEIDAAIKEIDV